MDSVTDDVPHNTDSDGNPNVFALERNDDGLWLNDNWAKPDNEWNPDSEFVFRLRNSFLFRGLYVAVFLFGIAEIFLPTPEHLARFLELQRNIFAVLVGNELAFPCDRNEKFERIQNQDAIGYLFRFLLLFGKISDISKLEQIEKFIFNSRAYGIPGSFGDMRNNINPNQISLFDSIQDRGGVENRGGGEFTCRVIFIIISFP